MKLTLVAVAARQPDWINQAFAEYSKRLSRSLPLKLLEIKPEPRNSGKTTAAILALEAQRIESALPRHCRRVVLDEHGETLDTQQLAARLQHWQIDREAYGEVALIIGGADGLDPGLKSSAHECLRLSSLTLPHGLARVILAEALYRAYSLSVGHPYHRE